MNKYERTVKIYPIYYAFTADLVFFIPIDTLFLAHVKNLTASQITFMNMFGLIVCIVFRKLVIKITQKINNLNSVRLGVILLFVSTLFLTFSKTFYGLLIYSFLSNLSGMFTSMLHVIIRHNLSATNKVDNYVKTINLGNILYGIVTLFTTLIAGYLYNSNNYLPLYITLFVILAMFFVTFIFIDTNENIEISKEKQNKNAVSKSILFIFLSGSLFASIFRVGQNNSKLFIQYELENHLSLSEVTIYITYIVFISRIIRITTSLFFSRLYHKYKLAIGNYLAITQFLSYLFLVCGHFINNFAFKLILMPTGYFIILGIRDLFQTYIEDVALRSSDSNYQQHILIDLESYRKIGQLIINLSFMLILLKYDLVVTETLLLLLSLIEIFINYKMTKLLKH